MGKRMRTAALVAAVAALMAPGMPAQGRAQPVDYVGGPGGNFCDPRNWSDGQVPRTGTDVRLDGTDDVVIDPAACGRASIAFRDLFAADDSHLTTMPGTILRTRDEFIEDNALVEFRSTQSRGRLLDPGALVFNPSAVVRRNVVLKEGVVTFGLGGTEPASFGHVGAGHYATLTARTHAIGGADLEVILLHGFVPQGGDNFQIITGQIEGTFANAPEGALVFTTSSGPGGVGLFAHYTSTGLELQARSL